MTRIFDPDGNDVTPPPRDVGELEHICEIGGEFDETSVTLYVYSETLDRNEVTRLLEVQPTKAWNAGERHPVGNGKSGKTRIVDWGKWWLTIDGDRSPVEPKIRKLFQLCTSNQTSWHTLASKYDIWITIAGHLDNWNRELNLEPEILQMMAERRLLPKVDVYFDSDTSESKS